jgi:Na+-translocating ferredoxin:NAD+ oxidoreductase RnfD subunit
MPPRYKIPLSVLVALVAIAVCWFQRAAGQPITPWVALALGAFMIFAMWLFPEAKASKDRA